MFIGVDLGGTNIKVGLFDREFHWLSTIFKPTESEKGSTVVVENIIAALQQLLDEAGLAPQDITAIGVGVPGLMDREKGISIFSPNFTDWAEVPIAGAISSAFGDTPVFIDNDVRMNLQGEWHFGAGVGIGDLVLLTIGTGLGAGVVLNHQVIYGHNGSAGEIGHMNMYRTGRPCACGSSGCLGRYVSARGIITTLQEKLAAFPESLISHWLAAGEELSLLLLDKAYDQGDELAVAVYRETGELLGYGLSNVINLYNPQRIIIGGGVSQAGERIFQYTREVIKSHSLKPAQVDFDLVTAQLGDRAGIIGAAYYASFCSGK